MCFEFYGTVDVEAENLAQAEEIIEKSLGLTLGGKIHSSDDAIKDWDFCHHPKKVTTHSDAGTLPDYMLGSLSKAGAIAMMEQGHKVTHERFFPTEYIWKTPDPNFTDFLFDETDQMLGESDFWKVRAAEHWETGWSIYSE